MNRYYSYLNSAVAILNQYEGKEPFAIFLKLFFSANKKYGSKDRKEIAQLCYCYFRTGKMNINLSVEERILSGLFLCSSSSSEILKLIRPTWNEIVGESIDDKFLKIGKDIFIDSVFPWKDKLSEGINHIDFCKSFFVQPDLFLRIRPGKEEKVKRQLTESEIVFHEVDKYSLRLLNTSKVDEKLNLDADVVVQDYSSQQTVIQVLKYLPSKTQLKVWDCCAASGGKSILLNDLVASIDLTVSDIRESILANLKSRFSKAGIKNYKSLVVDLSEGDTTLIDEKFDLIIADVPCSGSGTWSRTPEQLHYFEDQEINSYSVLQKKISGNVIKYLQPGGYLLYITCSVFKNENEEVVEFLKSQYSMEIKEIKLHMGYNQRADTLFTAVLYKPL